MKSGFIISKDADPLKSKPNSVKTGRTMKEIEKEESG